jgi:spore coat protein U-like protein
MQYPKRRGAGRASWLVVAWLLAIGTSAMADTGALVVTATVVSKGVCKFQTGPATLAFGTIDPASGTAKTATATIQVRCTGAGSNPNVTYSLVADNGANASGGVRRVRHATLASEVMAYSLAFSPASATIAKNTTVDITVSGKILPADFQNVASGAYSDTVKLDLYP